MIIILIDDASNDTSWEKILGAVAKVIKSIIGLQLLKNSGQSRVQIFVRFSA